MLYLDFQVISQGICIFKKPLKKSRLLSKSSRTNSGRRHHQWRNFNQILEMQSIGGVGVDKMNRGKAQVRVFTKRNTEKRRNNMHYKLRCINMVHLEAKTWKKLNENLYLEVLTSLPPTRASRTHAARCLPPERILELFSL